MDFSKVDDKGVSLDELVTDIKVKNTSFKSIFSDPNKFINKENDNDSIEIKDLDELYLKEKRDSRGLLDEHPFMGNLDCNSRLNYCFTNKDISKKCFDTNDILHTTYILPCKMRTELKKLINYIVNDIDIEYYKDSDYLRKSVKYHITNTLPKFNFSEEEINSLISSGRNEEQKNNIFTMDVNDSDISVIPVKDGRGIYIEYLLRLFKINTDLFKEIIDKYIDKLIIYYKYTELEAIDSGFKFLNTLVLGSETVDNLEEYYKDLLDKHKRIIREELDSDSE